jgi:hypothetical protein
MCPPNGACLSMQMAQNSKQKFRESRQMMPSTGATILSTTVCLRVHMPPIQTALAEFLNTARWSRYELVLASHDLSSLQENGKMNAGTQAQISSTLRAEKFVFATLVLAESDLHHTSLHFCPCYQGRFHEVQVHPVMWQALMCKTASPPSHSPSTSQICFGIAMCDKSPCMQGLHDSGLRVVQDVVYNHTFASGLDRYSVLDKVVPGYYHRRTESGKVCDSTCCNNTATEHLMAERLMIDDLVHWATHYRIDGFR